MLAPSILVIGDYSRWQFWVTDCLYLYLPFQPDLCHVLLREPSCGPFSRLDGN